MAGNSIILHRAPVSIKKSKATLDRNHAHAPARTTSFRYYRPGATQGFA
jgi:hypothetical protein